MHTRFPDGRRGSVDTIPKPDELLALHSVTEELFETLRDWFDVPDEVTLDLSEIDSAVTELGDPVMIAALAMRKLQALRLLSTPGVKTSTDVVVAIVQDLNRALLQAPAMRLHRAASTTDWDAEFAQMVEGSSPAEGPTTGDEEDEEAAVFRALHDQLHEAVYAVLRASEGEIRYLI
ncbi:MAG: hypothetical protein R3343_00645 [Nitriliruptorales bacterium]|nr:hypothetical protein [Nitriliruptorales bacterium]